MITEQIFNLRTLANTFEEEGKSHAMETLRQAADTIEQLSKGYNTVYYTPIEAEACQKAFENIRATLTAQNSAYKLWEYDELIKLLNKHDPLKAGSEIHEKG